MERVLRIGAMVIALLALWDPSISRMQRTRPVVSMVSEPGYVRLDSAIVSTLGDHFTLVHGDLPGAAALISVGDALPMSFGNIHAPVIAVTTARTARGVWFERVRVPPAASLDSRVAVQVALRARGGNGDSAEVTLRNGGMVVDRQRMRLSGDSAQLNATLHVVPIDTGVQELNVTATLIQRSGGRGASDTAVAAVNVLAQKRQLLFFDTRVSWMSTFVRRTIEADPRYAVTSRVVTSRAVSTSAGQPPATLSNAGTLEAFDAIVVGAPDALSSADIRGIEQYARNTGGTVILLFDTAPDSRFDNLLQTDGFVSATSPAPLSISAPDFYEDSIALRATEWLAPRHMPAGSRTLAFANAGRITQAVLFDVPVGAGRVIVSGALDAWRFRDADRSAFERVFPALLSMAVSSSMPPLEITLSPSVVMPGGRVHIKAVVRDLFLSDKPFQEGNVSAFLEMPKGRTGVTLYPTATRGELTGDFTAPANVGSYKVSALARVFDSPKAGADQGAQAALVVSPGPVVTSTDQQNQLETWAITSGGSRIDAAAIASLPVLIDKLAGVGVEPQRTTSHPMRSPWWIIPFSLLLGTEWWLRRRRGRA